MSPTARRSTSMSRATWAVDIEVLSGLPVVEHALACLSYALVSAFSCLVPYGNGTDAILASTGSF